MMTRSSSPHSTPTNTSPPAIPPAPPSAMAAAVPSPQLPLARRTNPSQLQTSSLATIPSSAIPASAISVSSVASSSQQVSPIMSPQTTQLVTNNSSVQASPEGPRGRETDVAPPPFELPESIVSRKSSQSAMSEAMSLSKGPGIIRRLSNRAANSINRRRQSSTTANSRDHSTGPVMMRKRSDSNSTAPELSKPSMFSESDDEEAEKARGELNIAMEGADPARDNYTASISGSVTSIPISAGPVIPSALLRGTTMWKVSKKKKALVTLVLDIDAAKVSWDKTRLSKSFYIDDVKEIRTGADARNYRQEFGIPDIEESRFFSILYRIPDKSKGRSQKLMHLVANNEETFELWTTTLDAISKHRHELMVSLSSFNDKAVKAYWRREMDKQYAGRQHTEDEEKIDLVGVERLCRNLHIHGVFNHLKAKFDQADTTRSGRLNFAEFQEFVKLMKRREDITTIFRELTSTSPRGLTQEQFLHFLRESQEEDVDANKSHWEMVFAKFVRRSKTKEQALQDTVDGEVPVMNEAALTAFLTSTFNVAVAEAPAQFSLDRPLNEYYISSSHNTYLLGRQVAGESSVEAYISALSRGCRSVEVDCWNGTDGQPVVMHGRTLTSQVSFIDVMTTISKYAFVKNSFPLIISLEVHCNREQQTLMAQIIKDTCGSKLVTEPLFPSLSELPSPSQLLNRILIKVKTPRIEDEGVVMESSINGRGSDSISSPLLRPIISADGSVVPSSSSSPAMSPQQRPTRVLRQNPLRLNMSSESQDSLSSSTSESETNEDGSSVADGTRRKKQSNIIKVLGELGVYIAGGRFHGFEAPESKTYNHILSFMESTFTKNSKTQDTKRALIRHNMRYLMRVYPNNWRVASTNFDPLGYWGRGVQMAALNWQTFDLGMQMNEAMFAAGTDQSGYVLKPSALREIRMLKNVPEEAGADYVKRERQKVNFSIDLISAQQLMRPKNLPSNRTFDPYIEVEVYHADDKQKEVRSVVGEGGLDASGRDGSSGLGVPHRRRTQIVEENGFNPVFNEKIKIDLTTKYPDLVFVRWTVRCSRDGHNYDDRGLPLAVYTAKLSSLQQGYRTLPLMDLNGEQFLFSTLFCRIKIESSTSIYVDSPDNENVGKLKSIGRSVFNRTPMSPKVSLDNSHA